MLSLNTLKTLAQKHGYVVHKKNDKFKAGDNIDGYMDGNFDTENDAWLYAAAFLASSKPARNAKTARLYARVLKAFETSESPEIKRIITRLWRENS